MSLITVGILVLSMSSTYVATAATQSPLQKEVTAINKSHGKFTYWIGLIFSDKANATVAEQIKTWAKSRKINAEGVLVNQNNLAAQITAAISAGTMPDALDISSSLMLQLGQANLKNIQGLVDEIGNKHGGYNKAALVFDDKAYAGKGLGVPFGITGNMINRRLDLLAAGKAKTTAPTTWEELLTASKLAQPKGGMAFALGNVGDAETIFDVQFHDYGGRIADDAGKTCTLNTQATKNFLAFVKKAYDSGAYPSDAVTTDGAWDNNKYLGGRTVFIANPGSVYTTMLGGSATWPVNAKLAKATGFSALPGGPVARVSPSDAWFRTIPAKSKYPELAKDLIRYLQATPQIQKYYASAIYGPTLKGYNHFTFFRPSVDPVRAGLYDLATNGTSLSFPDVNNAGYAEFATGFNLSQMVQRHLLDGLSADKTIAQAQTACQNIYDKHK